MLVCCTTLAGPLLVMVISLWAAATVTLHVVLVAMPDAESWARVPKRNEPAVVGVPVRTPVEGLMGPKPGGSDPVIENVYGGVPPVATRPRELYATPTWAVPSGQATVSGGVAVTVKLAEEVLLAAFGSGVGEATVAVFTTVPDALGLLTTSTTVPTPPAAIVPREQLTVLVPEQDDPAGVGVAETNVVPAGRTSVTVTLAARLGPAFPIAML
jgi:hypothetical protein